MPITAPTPANPESRVAPLSDQLVVDTPYVANVTDRLRGRLDVEVGESESDVNLGLALLSGLTEMTTNGRRPLKDLDPILIELRRQFAAEFHGWVPQMGRNRPYDTVFSSPNPDIHQDDIPASAEAPNWNGAAMTGGPGARVGLVD